ncbi:MAG: hypothetical protein KJT03_10740, partial [Verrucomicrobiae bacterium]|nr:hypothetical protein [Verrucomicrobiae bacterium]
MKRRFTCAALALLFGALFLEANWSPAEVPILTRWGHTVTPENAWTEYPRPQLRRSEWKNLNGLWDYAITEHDAPTPAAAAEGHILIPYSIDSALSGVRRQMDADEDIWYWRKFEIPEHWQGQRILLHFEAVDWRTEVWVNRQLVGTHTGGYAPFSFDITETLIEDGPQALMVKAWDPQDTLFKPLGKQANDEEQYDRCSGIWGTVWLEPVSAAHIRRLRITPNASGVVQIETDLSGSTTGTSFRYKVLEKGESILQRTSETGALELKIREPELWSPETPFLYGLKVYLLQYGEVVDEVESYFGLRSVGLVDTPLGKQMALNGKAIFQMGPLDQNYWPGGGLTPPSDEAMIWECQYLKAIGCNMVRLHIKQNPRRWYYHCDRMGLLVWQDFITAIK